MKWKDKVFKEIIKAIENIPAWQDITEKLGSHRNDFGVHVAIFSEPYLTLLIEGKKKVESRFSVNRISPFAKVHKGDIILVKRGGGPVVAIFIAGEIKFFSGLNVNKLHMIESQYAALICSNVDPAFWQVRENSKFGTLIEVDRVIEVDPIIINKSDRTAWSTVQNKVVSLFDKPADEDN